MKKIEKLVAKIGYNTAKKTVNSASAWHSEIKKNQKNILGQGKQTVAGKRVDEV